MSQGGTLGRVGARRKEETSRLLTFLALSPSPFLSLTSSSRRTALDVFCCQSPFLASEFCTWSMYQEIRSYMAGAGVREGKGVVSTM